MQKLKRFSIRFLFVVTLIFGVGITWVIAPRRNEFLLMEKLAKDAEPFKRINRYYSWWDKQIETVTGLPPCCISVTISGESPYWEDQLNAVSGLQSKKLRVYVDDFGAVSSPGLELQNVNFVYATRASGEFVGSILNSVPRLETLTLYDCYSVEDDDLAALNKCPMLKSLDLDGTGVEGSFLNALSNGALEKLSIRYSDCCSRESLKLLSTFDFMRDVYLSGSGSFDLMWLRDLQVLEKVVLEGFVVAENSVEQFKNELPEVKIQVLP